jgi:[acyl-carrier-protein] S-malonyltransferase
MLINPIAHRLVAEADDALGYSLIDRYHEDESEFSEHARVTFLVSSLALAYWAESALGVKPGACVGPSFGGTPAAVYSGALGFADAVRLTARWGHRLENYFAHEHSDVVTQSIARLPADKLALVLAELAAQDEWHEIACYVDEDFFMLSLREHKLDWLKARLSSLGALPLYTMRPPMHSSSFWRLREDIESTLFAELTFTDPRIPVISDHDSAQLQTGEEVRTMLLDGIVRPVRWPQALDTIKRLGVAELYISGPDALWGRVRCATDNFEVIPLTPQRALQPRRRSTAA